MPSKSNPSMSRRSLLKAMGVGGFALAAPSVLTACGGGDNGGSTGSVSNAGSDIAPWPSYVPFTDGPAPDLDADPAGVQAAFLKYPAELGTAVPEKPGDGSKIKVMTLTYGAPPKGPSENQYWKAVQDALGVEIDFTIVPAADFQQKMATVMAGNDVPDILNIGGGYVLPREAEFVKTKMADLSEYLSGDAAKDYPNLANIPTYAWESMGRIAGKIYGVPVERGRLNHSMWINRDVFDAAGYQPGMSRDDFTAMANAATKGKTFALGASMEGYFGHGPEHALWHGAPNEWQRQDDGTYLDMWGTDSFKAMLEYLASLNSDGVFNPDATATAQVDLKTQFYNGTVASITDGATAIRSSAAGIDGAFTLDQLIPYTTDLGDPGVSAAGGKFGYTVIKKGDAARVKLCLRILNWLASPFGTTEYELVHYGVEGQHFNRDADNNPITTELAEIEKTVPFHYLCDGPEVLYVPGYAMEVEAVHAWQTQAAPMGVGNDRTGLQSETMNDQGATLNQMLLDSVTAIVSGRKGIDTWDATYKKWHDDGGAKIAEELAKEYEANNA